MPRRFPRGFTLLAGCSLLLALAAAALWCLSHLMPGTLYITTRNMNSYSVSHRFLSLRLEPGHLHLIHDCLDSPLEPLGARPTNTEWFFEPLTPGAQILDWPAYAARRTTAAPYGVEQYDRAGCHLGFLCLLAALTPLCSFIRRLRSDRNPSPLCPICHYDLRATPTRCPECGHVPVGFTSLVESAATPSPPASTP